MELASLCNFRDVGGVATGEGLLVAPGRLFRSDKLARLSEEDRSRFASLGVRTIIDLRYPWEAAAEGEFAPAGVTYRNLSIEHRPYDQAGLGPDVDPVAYLGDRHAEVLEDGREELREVIETLAAPGALPAVVHCTSGKDRTGLVVGLVLALIGVGDDDIVADFARTEAATERLREHWRDGHPGRELVWPAYGTAPPALMRRLLADLDTTYGSPRAYARERLGTDDATLAALARNLLA